MKISRRKWLAVGIAFVLLACAAPFLPLSFLRPRVASALSAKLGRTVEIGDVSLTLFTGPGFALSNVLIHEDPRAGIEPFVYAETADARLDLLALLQGRRGFSSLRLVDATLNIVKTPSGDWNFQYFNAARLEDAPTLHLRNTRVNLKLGDTKSLLYFDAADLDVSPGNQGSVALRFSGVPGRTDHPAQNFGQLFVRGSWAPASAAQPLNLNIQLEPSSFDGIAKLFGRTWFDLQGQVSVTAQLAGPPSQLVVMGEAQLDEGRRSDFLPNSDAKWKLPFRGTADLKDESLQLENTSDAKAPSPVAGTLTAEHLTSSPLWSASFDLRNQPLDVALAAAHRVGVPLPDKLTGAGSASGNFKYDSAVGLSGTLQAHDVVLTLPETPALKAESVPLRIAAQMLSVGPVTLALGESQNAQVEASYKFDGSQAADVRLATRGMSLAALRPFSAARLLDHVLFANLAPDPKSADQRSPDQRSADQRSADQRNAVQDSTDRKSDAPANRSSAPDPSASPGQSANAGMWRGAVRYQANGADAQWSGDYSVENAQIALDGIADPIRIQFAAVSAAPGRVTIARIKGLLGDIAFTGEYASGAKSAAAQASPNPDAKSALPNTFKLQIPEASAAELQREFAPSLAHGHGNLASTLHLGNQPPASDSLSQRKLEGSVSIASLTAGDGKFALDAPRFIWDGTSIRVSPLNLRSLGGSTVPAVLNGDLSLDLSPAAAQYRLKGKLAGLPFDNGRVDFDGQLEASGEGPSLLASLRATGSLSGRAIAFSRETTFRTASAQFELSMQAGAPRWKFLDVEVTRGNEIFKGDGSSQPDGKLVLDLKTLGKPVQFTGSIVRSSADRSPEK